MMCLIIEKRKYCRNSLRNRLILMNNERLIIGILAHLYSILNILSLIFFIFDFIVIVFMLILN